MADVTTRQVGALNSLEYRLYFGKFFCCWVFVDRDVCVCDIDEEN